jgi:cobalt-precorrin-7 (C5)-methyltransferase
MELANFLIGKGVHENRKAVVCEKLSYEDERIVEASLKDILEIEFSYMSVMVIY